MHKTRTHFRALSGLNLSVFLQNLRAQELQIAKDNSSSNVYPSTLLSKTFSAESIFFWHEINAERLCDPTSHWMTWVSGTQTSCRPALQCVQPAMNDTQTASCTADRFDRGALKPQHLPILKFQRTNKTFVLKSSLPVANQKILYNEGENKTRNVEKATFYNRPKYSNVYARVQRRLSGNAHSTGCCKSYATKLEYRAYWAL